MNVDSLSNFLQSGAVSSDRSLIIRADAEFNLTLKLGQVLKGKVLRHYEGGRYAVSFGGQEKVVDSSVPLRIGESIQGRVVGIDDKVHLQRVVESSLGGTDIRDSARFLTDQRDAIAALFTRYQMPLTPAQHSTLMRLRAQSGGSNLLGPSALIVQKLGLPLNPVLVKAVHHVLEQMQTTGSALNTDIGPKFDGKFSNAAVDATVVQGLAPILARLVEQFGSRKETSGDKNSIEGDIALNESAADAEFAGGQQNNESNLLALGSWILNIQSEGSLAHRQLQFPVWINDRLMEINIAFFSQVDDRNEQDGKNSVLRHRKVVFSLSTEHLGKIEIEALVAEKHLRLALNTDQETAAELLGEHLTILTSALTQHGWRVDEIVYRTKDKLSGVMQSIIEHQITPNSLSRLM